MIIIHNGKKEAPIGLKKPHRQNRELGKIKKGKMLNGVIKIDRWSEKCDGGKTSVQTKSNHFLNMLTEGAVTMEVRKLFQYFTTLVEKADPLLRQWLPLWSTLEAPSGGSKK